MDWPTSLYWEYPKLNARFQSNKHSSWHQLQTHSSSRKRRQHIDQQQFQSANGSAWCICLSTQDQTSSTLWAVWQDSADKKTLMIAWRNCQAWGKEGSEKCVGFSDSDWAGLQKSTSGYAKRRSSVRNVWQSSQPRQYNIMLHCLVPPRLAETKWT